MKYRAIRSKSLLFYKHDDGTVSINTLKKDGSVARAYKFDPNEWQDVLRVMVDDSFPLFNRNSELA